MTAAVKLLPLVPRGTPHLPLQPVVVLAPANTDTPKGRRPRLFLLKFAAGLTVPLAIAVGLLLANRQPTPPIDLSLPAPALSLEADAEVAPPRAARLLPRRSVPLAPSNFQFEFFAQTTPEGRVQLFNNIAEGHLRRWFPTGTPITSFLRFLSNRMEASGLSAAEVRASCVSIPQNRAFRQATITCSYQHALPASLNQPKARVFWIVSASYDNTKRLSNIQVHGRLTRAR